MTDTKTTSLAEQARAQWMKVSRLGVIGAGVSGRAAAGLLLGRRKEVVLFDDTDRSDDPEVVRLAGQGARLSFGEFRRGALDEVEALVVSPGVRPEHPLLAEAAARGLPAIGEVELAWLHSNGAKTVAVTGTNGKTTVTMLVGHILRSAGLNALDVGNIGHAFCDAVVENEARLEDLIFVVEVSSFQLFATRSFAPDVAILLNVTPDHLDWHKTMENYARAKGEITAHQTGDQALVVNQDDANCLAIAQKSRAKVYRFSLDRAVDRGAWLDDDRLVLSRPGRKTGRLADLDGLTLYGMHNVANCLAAACAAAAIGLGRKAIGGALENFQGAPHRLQDAGELRGVRFFNDSKATNLDSMVKAVASFSEPIHLIAGGRDKDSPFKTAVAQLAGKVERVYLIGEASETIARAWKDHLDVEECGTLEVALERACENASEGEVVLLSPACASFDQFSGYGERGRAFMDWIAEKRKTAGEDG